jgi:hypothetical protein
MTPKEAEKVFIEMGGAAFFTIYQLESKDRLAFLEYVKNREADPFDHDGTMKAFILSTIELFNNNPKEFEEKAEQVKQLKLL